MRKVPVITIMEQSPGQFMATSVFGDQQTAAILLNLAMNFVRQDTIKKYEKKLNDEGTIINPHTGKKIVVPNNGN